MPRSPVLRSLGLGVLALALAGAAQAAASNDLEARRVRLAELAKEVEAQKKVVGPLVNATLPKIPAFAEQLQALHQVPLSRAEREVILSQGIEGLAPEKKAHFEEAAPAFQDLKGSLEAYFAAYDEHMRGELALRKEGAVLKALERRLALEPHLSDKARRKLDPHFAKLAEMEDEYEAMRLDPNAKHYKLFELLRDIYFQADDLDDELLRWERKYKLAPRVPFGHKVGNFFRKIKGMARKLKIQAVSLPAVSRLFTHVFLRPFWNKTHDADKTNELIRFYSKSYRWAAGLRLRVTGQEGIPSDAPVVFALSHRATIEDAMTMTAVVPGTYSFMWAADAMPAWLTKRLVADPTVIAVGGKNPDGTKVDAVEESIKVIEQGRNLALFPEGNVPSPQKETRPLRAGIDVITQEVGADPVYIVPITIDDTAIGYGEERKPSERRKMNIDVTVGAAIDPIRLRAVPGADRQFLLNVIRGIYHRNLYRPDVALDPPSCPTACDVEDMGVVPDRAEGTFQELHGE